jgi:hypothetical protein
LWCSQLDDHPQEDLAKFGYSTDMKIEKIKNRSIFWLHARTYCQNLAILFFFEICRIGIIFSQKSSVCLKIIQVKKRK